MKTDAEWAKELQELGISACGFWKCDQAGRAKLIEYFKWLKEHDEKEGERITPKRKLWGKKPGYGELR